MGNTRVKHRSRAIPAPRYSKHAPARRMAMALRRFEADARDYIRGVAKYRAQVEAFNALVHSPVSER